MTQTKTKMLALLMSVVLAFSMVSASALSAFADDLVAAGANLVQQPQAEKIVYDSVYGVAGGEYALMVKAVTYEKEYDGVKKQYTGYVTDVVKADGTVAIHTSSAPEDASDVPGGKADYEITAVNGYGNDIDAGYVGIIDKNTGKRGLKTLNGGELVPCAYDSLQSEANGFTGIAVTGSSVTFSFFDASWESAGSIVVAGPSDASQVYGSVSYYGEYVQMRVSSGDSDGAVYAYAKKDGSQYVKVDGVERIYGGRSGYGNAGSDDLLIVKSDGHVYWHAEGQEDVRLASAENLYNAGFQETFAVLNYRIPNADDPGSYNYPYEYYTRTGSEVVFPENLSGRSIVGDYIVGSTYEWDAVAQTGATRIHAYDASGNALRTYYEAEGYVYPGISMLNDSHFSVCVNAGTNEEPSNTITVYNVASESPVYTIEPIQAKYPSVSKIDDTHFSVSYQEGDGDSAYSYAIYETATGKAVFGPSSMSSPVVVWPLYSDTNGENSIVGYDFYDYSSSSTRYFDTSFNELAGHPGNMVMLGNEQVFTEVSWHYDDQIPTGTYSSSVVDSAGNPVVLGGYTLGIAVDTEQGSYNMYNTVKHGNADIWWATDSNGKWGAVDSAGAVKVPFKFESYYDAGKDNTDYALVKTAGEWAFYDVVNGEYADGSVYTAVTEATADDGTQVSVTVKADLSGLDASSVALPAGDTDFELAVASGALSSASSEAKAAAVSGATNLLFDVSLTSAGTASQHLTLSEDFGIIELTFNVGSSYAGKKATVTEIHASSTGAKQVIPFAAQKVNGSGNVTVSVDKLSEFVVSIEDYPSSSESGSGSGSGSASTSTAEKVTMYRLYNPYSGEHFYTGSTVERDQVKAAGWNDEGTGWIAPKTSSTPVYRLYNQYAGDHHYTTSATERDQLKAIGWNDEGTGWYSDDAETTPLYRQYNPYATTGSHNYTTSSSENDQLVALGWKAEGIGWYGV